VAEIVLVRHGETEWSRDGRHTGNTDIPLTEEGRAKAKLVGAALAGRRFSLVLTSPLERARETCRQASLEAPVEVLDDLREWDYGEYEGRTTAEIRSERPGWSLWTDGAPGGETAGEVGRRADRVLTKLDGVEGDAAVFAHGHVLRVLAARWLGLPAQDGRLFALGTAAISVLGYERETRVLVRWNDTSHLEQPERKYVPVRRLALWLEETLDRELEWVVFEPNEEPVWARVREQVERLLLELWRGGTLAGATPAEALFVRCDRTTMTQDDIDSGRLVIQVGVAPREPGKFEVFRIERQTAVK
jgi:probable phosphoglycerate mutase